MTHIDKKNLLSERRTRCILKWACYSLVESNDPVGNLTHPLPLASYAPWFFQFLRVSSARLIKTLFIGESVSRVAYGTDINIAKRDGFRLFVTRVL